VSIISAPDWMLVRELIGTAAGVSRRRLTGKMVFVTLAMSWLHRMRLRTKACRRGMKLPQRIERVSACRLLSSDLPPLSLSRCYGPIREGCRSLPERWRPRCTAALWHLRSSRIHALPRGTFRCGSSGVQINETSQSICSSVLINAK
jgi:hypothetical protein